MPRPANIEAVIRELADHLAEELSVTVLTMFPEPSRALSFPCMCLTYSSPPELVLDLAAKKVESQTPTDPEDEEDFTATVLYQVGDYNVALQLDIWAVSKSKREELLQSVFETLNPEIEPMGLTLTLEEYHSVKCHYLMTSYGHESDGQEAAQRGEWRTRLTLLATCKAIRSKTEFIMDTVEVEVDVVNNIPNEEDS